MNHLQRTLKLFEDLGVPFAIDQSEGFQIIEIKVDENSANQKIQGYNGFTTTYFFDGEGKFLRLNVWE